MESNLPEQYKEGIFSKIKKFFLKIFGKNNKIPKEVNDISGSNKTKKVKQNTKNSIEIMKEENKKIRGQEEILSQIEENPELINDWSIDNLLKLAKIYDEKIEKCQKEILILKNK